MLLHVTDIKADSKADLGPLAVDDFHTERSKFKCCSVYIGRSWFAMHSTGDLAHTSVS